MRPGTKRAFALLLVMAVCASILYCAIPANAVPIKSEKDKVQLDYREPEKTETPSVFWMVVQMFLALGLIVFLAWGFIQLLGRRLNNKLQGRWIRVVDEVMLGQNRGIVAMEIGGHAFLVGVTDHNISMLLEISDPKLVEDMIAAGFEEPAQADALGVIVNRIREQFSSQANHPTTGEFHHVLDDKVRSLERMASRVRRFNEKGESDEGPGR